MYDPNNQNNRNPDMDAQNKSTGSAPYTGAQQNTQGPVWEGTSYHSGPIPQENGAPQNGASQGQPPVQNADGASQWHQNTWQPPQYQNPGTQPPHHREKKPKGERRGMPVWGRVLAGIVGCFVISAASIGVFVGLVNSGYIHLNATSSGTGFTINRLVSSGDTTANTTNTSGLLTKQQVAEKVVPSVVLIQNYQTQASQGSLYDYFFGGQQGSQDDDSGEDQLYSEGSGVIMSADGYIITNAHVVEDADALTVVTSDNKSYEAQIIGADEVTDLALIKIDATGLTPAEFGSSSDLSVGDDVVAVGNPGGSELASSVTYGNISALNRSITNSDTGYTMQCIQTDAAINPGNSGGALANMYGQVIGINSSKLTEVGGTAAEGLNFAIPIDTAQPIISNLQAYGYVKDRAQLGISGRDINDAYAQQIGLSQGGVMIFRITNESLTNAGVQVGDIITKIDDTDVDSAAAISSYIAMKKAGDKVTLTLIDGQSGQEKTAEVTLAQQTGQQQNTQSQANNG